MFIAIIGKPCNILTDVALMLMALQEGSTSTAQPQAFMQSHINATSIR